MLFSLKKLNNAAVYLVVARKSTAITDVSCTYIACVLELSVTLISNLQQDKCQPV